METSSFIKKPRYGTAIWYHIDRRFVAVKPDQEEENQQRPSRRNHADEGINKIANLAQVPGLTISRKLLRGKTPNRRLTLPHID